MNPRDRVQKEIAEALASLNLPQMPTFPSSSAASASASSPSSSSAAAAAQQPFPTVEPTITILVVADLDLLSASALFEYTLEHQLSVDLCIACGSFCRDEDLHPYMRGSSSSTLQQQQQQQQQSHRHRGTAAQGTNNAVGDPQHPQHRRGNGHRRGDGEDGGAIDGGTAGPFGSSGGDDEAHLLQEEEHAQPPDGWSSTPLFRTREQTAALEGLMTATLSQLENIVCRVVYCPGSSDPLTCLIHHQHLRETAVPVPSQEPQIQQSTPVHHPPPQQPRRLTPNSRNLHQQWLPLAPGLGAAALLYLDCSERIVRETRDSLTRWQHHHHTPPSSVGGDGGAATATPAPGSANNGDVLVPVRTGWTSLANAVTTTPGSANNGDGLVPIRTGWTPLANTVTTTPPPVPVRTGWSPLANTTNTTTTSPVPIRTEWTPLANSLTTTPPAVASSSLTLHPDDGSDGDDDDEQGAEDVAFWVDQLQHLQHKSGRGYGETLERLLHLAPPPIQRPTVPRGVIPIPPQTILVTHYVDCTPWVPSAQSQSSPTPSPPTTPPPPPSSSRPDGSATGGARGASSSGVRNDPGKPEDDDFWPANGCPVWALPEREDYKQDEGGNDQKEEEVEGLDEQEESASTSSSSSASSSDLMDPLPWPVEEHRRFHSSETARERLCLEIASGSPALHRPRLLRWEPGPRRDRHENDNNNNNNNKNANPPHTSICGSTAPVLLPGSLREWGEFSVVHVSLVPDNIDEECENDGDDGKPPSSRSTSSRDGGGAVAATTTTTTTTTTPRPRSKEGGATMPVAASAVGTPPLSPTPTTTTAPSSSPPPPSTAATSPTNNNNKTTKRSYSWVVQNVDFYKLSERKA